MRKVFIALGLVIVVVMCSSILKADYGRSGYNQGDLKMQRFKIQGDSSEGLKFDPDADGTTEIVMTADGGMTLSGDTSLAQNVTVEGVCYVDNVEPINGNFTVGGVHQVANDESGATFTLARQAPEGNDRFELYVNSSGTGTFYATDIIQLVPEDYKVVQINAGMYTDHTVHGDGVQIGSDWVGEQSYIRHYGRVAGANPYIQFQLDDTEDDYNVTRSATSIGGLDISMDVTMNNSVFITNIPTSDPSVAGAVWSDGGTLKVSAG